MHEVLGLADDDRLLFRLCVSLVDVCTDSEGAYGDDQHKGDDCFSGDHGRVLRK